MASRVAWRNPKPKSKSNEKGANGIPYQGINVLELWSAAVIAGYAAPIWMTFKQAQELGGHVRKGEHGWQVVYVSKVTRTETDTETGEENARQIPFMRCCTVFNVEQIEGLPAHYYAVHAPKIDPVQRNARAEAFFTTTGAEVRHSGTRAYYDIASDFVQIPPFETFRDPESYYATRGHETVHNADTLIMPRRTLRAPESGAFRRGWSA